VCGSCWLRRGVWLMLASARFRVLASARFRVLGCGKCTVLEFGEV
jgi:hypothetical protein